MCLRALLNVLFDNTTSIFTVRNIEGKTTIFDRNITQKVKATVQSDPLGAESWTRYGSLSSNRAWHN